MSLIGRGVTGTVYQLNAFIALKKARLGEDEESDHTNEQRIFELLEKYLPIPHLIRCYYRTPKNTFLEFVPNGSVAMLLNKYQHRNTPAFQVLEVTHTLDSQDVHRWMKQLCSAAAGLERVGLSHGDIRPGNMLLDAKQNLILSDLDRGMEIGEEIAVLSEPYGRLLNKEAGAEAGTYGKASARVETFAIGSVYYTLLRGHEPYETESWGRNHFVILGEKFQEKEFPSLNDSAADTIISKCWNGEYQSISELLVEFAGTNRRDDSTSEDREYLRMRQQECKTFVRSGWVDTLERY
ncbi:MAG: hypothetical protein Q9217_007005 [Psora testacea]